MGGLGFSASRRRPRAAVPDASAHDDDDEAFDNECERQESSSEERV